MKTKNLHIQHHGEYDSIFITYLPDKIGAKASNHGLAVERESEFFHALRFWAAKSSFVPVGLRYLRKWFRIKPKFVSATRVWSHPEGDFEITVVVKERVA